MVVAWRNLKNIKEQPPITAVDSYFSREPGQPVKDGKFLLFIGDEAGKVTVQDISAILRKNEDLEEIDVTDPKRGGQKRNPFRMMQIADRKGDEKSRTEAEENFKENPQVNESEIKQICTFSPHKDVIKSI